MIHLFQKIAGAFLIALAIFACGETASSVGNIFVNLPSSADLPYYIPGFTIDPETGVVSAIGSDGPDAVVGQLNADGTVTDKEGNVILEADTTVLPKYSDGGLLINKNGQVTDINGNLVGTLDENGKSITQPDGTVTDLNGNVLPIEASSSSDESESPIIPDDPIVETSSSSTTSGGNLSAGAPGSSSSAGGNTGEGNLSAGAPESSSSTPIVSDCQYTECFVQTVNPGQAIETITLKNVSAEPTRSWNLYWLEQPLYDANSKTFTIKGTVPTYFQEGTVIEVFTFENSAYSLTLHIGNVSTPSSSSVKPASSSSAKPASSSSAKQSSSSAKQSSSSTGGGNSPNITPVENGKKGSGWATRYWDCCKPSCAWKENAHGNPTKQCYLNGSTLSDASAQSVCNGGSAATCTSQIPMVINDNLAYAFAAVPAAAGGDCGKCFMLTFTGKGKYETKTNHEKLKGKKLVVMASNIGSDVESGQFDIMIPGGGVGIFNGCSGIWGNNLGKQYGGLLSDCEDEVGYNGDVYQKRKDCLKNKCNSVFASHAQAKEGCLFLANWMEAAGNPNHDYVEVECPAELKAKW